MKKLDYVVTTLNSALEVIYGETVTEWTSFGHDGEKVLLESDGSIEEISRENIAKWIVGEYPKADSLFDELLEVTSRHEYLDCYPSKLDELFTLCPSAKEIKGIIDWKEVGVNQIEIYTKDGIYYARKEVM